MFYDIIRLAKDSRKGGVQDIRTLVEELKAKIDAKKIDAKKVNKIHMIAAAMCLLVMISFFIMGSSDQVLVAGDQGIAKVSNQSVYEEALEILKAEQEAELGVSIDELHSEISFSTEVKYAGKSISDPRELVSLISPYVSGTTNAYALQVNDVQRVFVKTEEEAEKILESIKDKFIGESEEVVAFEFRENVEVVQVAVAATKIMETEEAKNFILTGTDKIEVYKVAKGDTLSTIAQKQGVGLSTLREANPQLKGDLLSIGQELKLVKLEPVLHVMVTKEVKVEQQIPFSTRTINTNNLYTGQTRVQKAGTRGLKEVTYKVVSENGRELNREELGAVVLQEPSVQEVLRGTKQMTASRGGGDGQLGWPLRGNITSRYGPRGGGFHTGIDIGASRGTPTYSAGNGTVIFAGWGSGGYGNLVIIDHGNGLTTKYAHLASINVKMAQNVSRGAVVGTVGTTGRSTGPHLHFETNVNGRHVNPTRYLGN